MTYLDRLFTQLRNAGPRTVVRHGHTDVSGDFLLTAVTGYAAGLRGRRIGPGAVVAVAAPTCPDALAIHYACHAMGAAMAYLPDTEGRTGDRLMTELAPDLMVVFAETADTCPASPPGVPTVEATRLQAGADLAGASSPRPGDLAMLSSSGGTTGAPKWCIRDFRSWSRLVDGPEAPTRRRLVDGPLANLSGVLADQTLLGGGTVVMQDRFEVEATLRAVERERITDLFVVEPQLVDLVDHPQLHDYDLSSLQRVTHVGTSAPAELRRRARDRLGPILVHPYAASETGVVSVLTPADTTEWTAAEASAGAVVPGVSVRFRGRDRELDPTTGTIEVRSPAAFQGYRNGASRTHLPVDGGWVVTGDRGHLDDSGFLHVDGRAADCLVCGDRIIGPTAIEDALMGDDGVRYAVVFFFGDSLVAAAVPWAGATVDASQCLDLIRDAFGRECADTVRMTVLGHLPTTRQGKPDRRAIAASLARRGQGAR